MLHCKKTKRHHCFALQRGVTLDFSRPGKPTDNAFIEAFSGRFGAECLNAGSCPLRMQEKVEDWRRYYNEERPHAGDWQKAADFAYSKCQSVTELNWRQPARIGLLEQLAPSPIEGRQSDN